MTATILQSELSSLIQDSKKKSPDVRNAAEKSLGDLKSISITSEAQLAGDLVRRPHFVDPFILACRSRNTKLVSSAVVCLQRLAASRALPRERLQDVVDAFQEVTSNGLDVQLKILQTLPSLLQIYARDVEGNLLAAILGVCGDLQDNKAGVVSSTATATFQQLITTVYEKVTREDSLPEVVTVESLNAGNTTIEVGAAGYDAFRIFNDLCAFANGAQLEFLRIKSVSLTFVMELIDGILHSSEEVFQRHPEQVEACRVYLMPAIMKILSAKQNFALTVRALRILSILLTRHLKQTLDESETAFYLVIRGLDLGSGPSWKRVLYLEFLQRICSNAGLLRQMFFLFDREEGRNNTVANMIAAFVRIASERPTLIGIGHQSTVPFRRGGNEDNGEGVTSLEAAGVAGVISATASAESNVTGISTEWSTVKTPYLDQLDKSDVSEPPSTYVYALVLNSVAAFSEGLAKYIMPLSVQSKSQTQRQQRNDQNNEDEMGEGLEGAELARSDSVVTTRSTSGKYSMLINPLKLTKHPHFEEVKTCAAMIDECWPAFLATCSTFLNAALDADFYHVIVRAFQKLTQVAGVLELTTPRDAMLTTLAKAAVPAGSVAASTPNMSSKTQSRSASIAEVPLDTASEPSSETDQRPGFGIPRRSIDQDRPSITTRNLLCLRALINLGIALGATLNPDSWFTILETLQQAECVIEISNRVLAQQSTKDANDATNSLVSRTSLGAEISAVQTASRRMFEGTASYSDTSLNNILLALVRFSGTPIPEVHQDSAALSPIPSTPTTPQRRGRMHQYSRSFSTLHAKSGPEQDELQFFLSHMGEIARLNLLRLVSEPPIKSGWTLIFQSLFHVVGLTEVPNSQRLQPIALMNRIVVESMNMLGEDNHAENAKVQLRCLQVFQSQYEILYDDSPARAENTTLDFEIHVRLLDALHSVLESCNNIDQNGWKIILQLICSPYSPGYPAKDVHGVPNFAHDIVKARSPKLVQPSFGCLQLVGSDFLALLSITDLTNFIDALWLFARQDDNLNIALTSTNFFWNIALYLQSLIGEREMPWEDGEVIGVPQLNNIEKANRERSLVEVWMFLVIRLIRMTSNNREDVRDSAIRIFTRVLDLFGHNMSAALWTTCLELALQAMSAHLQQATLKKESSWEKSLVMMTEALIDLSTRQSALITSGDKFPKLSQHIFEAFNAMLALGSLPVASVVYTSASSFLTILGSCNAIRDHSASAGLELWQARHPADSTTTVNSKSGGANADRPPETSNQESFTRHAEFFLKLHELFPEQTMRQLDASATLESMHKTIFACIHPPYTSDINKLASEQERVLAMLPILYEKMTTNQDEFVRFLLGFSRAALLSVKGEVDGEEALLVKPKGRQRPTFVAFSCKCIDMLESILKKSTTTDASVAAVLDTLSEVIQSKYTSTPQGTDPVLWRNATRKVIGVIEVLMPEAPARNIVEHSRDPYLILTAVVNVATSILGSGGLKNLAALPENTQIIADEAFDIESFMHLQKVVNPRLARWDSSSPKARETCRSYMVLLLRTSFICAPFYGDLPPDLVKSPLESFSEIRPGTVCPPVFPPRLKIPYIALDTLFNLASDSSSSQPAETPSLAATAAPYLILRCAWSLKTFIADQPLRSLSPLPKPLRFDLYTIVTKCLQTKTLDSAFTRSSLFGAPNSQEGASLGEGGARHLRLLYPPILKFLAVWRRVPKLRGGGDWMEEEEARGIERGLEEWLSVIGKDWVLDDHEYLT
jgi:Dimerisation and cyclophilin-binding domain of Mon2/Guanine nucleotide exchange factor in Golgi transport N-terminal